MKELDTKDNLSQILERKRQEEEEKAKKEAEKLRQAYMIRTGRSEMKP